VSPLKVTALFANYELWLNQVNLGSSLALSGGGNFSFWCSGHGCILPRNETAGNLYRFLSVQADHLDRVGLGLKKEFLGPEIF